MRTARVLTIVATLSAALVLTLGVAAAQTSGPSAAEVKRAKVALKKFTAANAPKTEAKPTTLDGCPWGDNLMVDLASQQADFDAAADAPNVVSSVFVDQTIDKGVRSIPCTANYTGTAGDRQSLTVVTYADPSLKTPAFAKALAKETKGKLVAMDPPSPTLAGGKSEGYCVKYSSSTLCSYVWSRDGLYVEIDGDSSSDSNFTALRDVVLAVVDALPDAQIGAPTN